MRPLSTSSTEARERRDRYAELRREGADTYEAARQVGVADAATRTRYERWYRAGLAGAVEECNHVCDPDEGCEGRCGHQCFPGCGGGG